MFALILLFLALTGLSIIIVPIGVYIWYRIALAKKMKQVQK